jgi:protein-L-isoaspartate O-methyltransferase
MQRIDENQTIDPRAVRSMVHAMWASVAGHWAEHADYVDSRGPEATALMLDRAGLATGQSVLELACGPGTTGLAAARLVGPTGRVVVSDVAAAMAEIARARADALGLANVESAVLDL